MVLELIFAVVILTLLVVVDSKRARLVLALLFIAGGVLNLDPGLLFPFRTDDWLEAKRFRRRLMAYDFVTHVPFAGKTRVQLEALLGKDYAERDTWMYDLDTGANKNSATPPQLIISFDASVVSKVFITDGWEPPQAQTPFDEAQWRAVKGSARAQMITDLFRGPFVNSVTHVDKAALLQRLGPPDHRTEAKELEYDLGVFPWIGEVAGKGLVFLMSDNDRVLSAEIVRHKRGEKHVEE